MIMKILIAIDDLDYVEHLSGVLAEKYADTFEESVCSSADSLREALARKTFDAALLEPRFIAETNLSRVKLPLLLRNEDSAGEISAGMERVEKYQRISSIVSEILCKFAKANPNADVDRSNKTCITAVWSPEGGVGKTSVAMAYAAQQVSQGKKTAYLSLQSFSDGVLFFPQTGKSISSIFGSGEGSISLLAQSVRLQDQGSGIMYFCDPTNYDDIYELTVDDVEVLLKGCASGLDELVVDLSNEWNCKIERIFEVADGVMVVLDGTKSAKWNQFVNQHNVYGLIKDKLKIVVNRGDRPGKAVPGVSVSLPCVQSNDPVVVYKTLSGYFA